MEHQYQHKAHFYNEGRMGYAQEAIELIEGMTTTPQATIADIGSGTGVFSASLLEKGYHVYGIEPDEMLSQKAKERLCNFKGFTAVTASAEDTHLTDRSVDGITAASAFHWFDAKGFARECNRIIKPNGYAFLIYNIRETKDSFSQEQQRICRNYCKNFTSFHHGADKAKEQCDTFFTKGYKEARYTHDLIYTKEQFLSRCLSSSYSLNQDQENYPAYQHELAQLIGKYSSEGLIMIHNHTVVWYGIC